MTSLSVKRETVHGNQVSCHITRIWLLRNIPHWLSRSSLYNSEGLEIYTRSVTFLISVRLLKQKIALTKEISVISNGKNLFPWKSKKRNHLKKRQNKPNQIKKRKKLKIKTYKLRRMEIFFISFVEKKGKNETG